MHMALALLAATAGTQPIYGFGVAGDGDSLKVGGVPVRLYGIDAPEFDQTCQRGGKAWACGADASQYLAKLVTGRDVRCVPNGKDQYDRVLARCFVLGREVNAAMVEQGFAVAFLKYSDDYVAAEARARAAKRGIWAGTFQMPGEYRAAGRVMGPQRRARAERGPGARPEPRTRYAGGCVIKGNRSRRGEWIYHLPGMPYYDETRAEDLFCSEAAAQAAGYRRAIVR